MKSVFVKKNGVSVKAYAGDAMTLLAFDILKEITKNCVGFTIKVIPPNVTPDKGFYLPNRLSFEQEIVAETSVANRPSKSSKDAPIQKFRWLHVPSSTNDNLVTFGEYTYQITPRYWDIANNKLLELDDSLTVEAKIDLQPFVQNDFKIGFTRGFMISQAYARRFGNDSSLRPKDNTDLVFDTSQESGKFPINNKPYAYKAQYDWMGWQAHDRVFEFINEVENNQNLVLDVFAYDFNEPDLAKIMLALASEGRVRVILDNYSGHVEKDGKKSFEDKFEDAFNVAKKGNAVLIRGRYARQAHMKVMIIREKTTNKALKVLTGSTNFAINGLYINANHVLIFNDLAVAGVYASVFDKSIIELSKSSPKVSALQGLPEFATEHTFATLNLPNTKITFAPHSEIVATKIINDMADNIKASESVLFAVMELGKTTSGEVVHTLRAIHDNDKIFSYGITDKSGGITVLKPGTKKGILVDTSSMANNLPEPFAKEAAIGFVHRVHHKFVVLNFNSPNPTVYLGSSNLALKAEQENGDNLIEVRDREVVAAFAIEAIRLIDHYHFRAAMKTATIDKPLNLAKDDSWLNDYFDKKNMKFFDRTYFVKK